MDIREKYRKHWSGLSDGEKYEVLLDNITTTEVNMLVNRDMSLEDKVKILETQYFQKLYE